jgi:hypothetical protein
MSERLDFSYLYPFVGDNKRVIYEYITGANQINNRAGQLDYSVHPSLSRTEYIK